MATTLGGELFEDDRFGRHLAFPTNPMFKGVWRSRLESDEVDNAIDEAIAWFEARKAPYFFWWTGPNTTPTDLGERLIARGLISMEEQARSLVPGITSSAMGAPGMVADLSSMNEAVLDQAPSGLVIDELRDEVSLDAFRRVLVDGMEMPVWAGQAWADAARFVGIGRTPWRMYLGYLNGEPVATNMLFCGGGVASVYGVATLPTFRGRGIGGAITLVPLLQARAAGYRHAVLFSSDMGVHAYQRIGFRATGGYIDRYLWRQT
jgi:GNAT superfamily N-acetyltransferase